MSQKSSWQHTKPFEVPEVFRQSSEINKLNEEEKIGALKLIALMHQSWYDDDGKRRESFVVVGLSWASEASPFHLSVCQSVCQLPSHIFTAVLSLLGNRGP